MFFPFLGAWVSSLVRISRATPQFYYKQLEGEVMLRHKTETPWRPEPFPVLLVHQEERVG